jgi:hypothetical protein
MQCNKIKTRNLLRHTCFNFFSGFFGTINIFFLVLQLLLGFRYLQTINKKKQTKKNKQKKKNKKIQKEICRM